MLRPPEFLAAHMNALVFLIFILVAGIFRLLGSKTQQAQKRDKESTAARPEPTFERTETEETDQERIRRFLEALGQPPSATPPPPVKPRPVENYEPPQRQERARTVRPRNILNPLPPLTTAPPPLPRKIRMPAQMTPEAEAPRTFTPVPAPADEYQVQETTAAPAPPLPPLATPADAYAAVTKPTSATVTASARPALATLLARPETLRQAILLREILGPPRALQPLEI